MLISSAYAQTPAGGDPTGILMQIAPLILIFVVFYFLLIRPQQQARKRHMAMVAALKKNDDACAVYDRLAKEYPTAPEIVRRRANEEKRKSNCR